MSEKLVVAVRVRPLNARGLFSEVSLQMWPILILSEVELDTKAIVRIDGNQVVVQPPPIKRHGSRYLVKSTAKTFEFDHSYNSSDDTAINFAGQNQLYDDIGKALLQKAFDGYNCCIFAYGQTGSGKSYSMMGHKDDAGLIPLICEELFRQIESLTMADTFCTVEVSYLEIFSEKVQDLLGARPGKNLRVREHPVSGPYVEDLSKLTATSFTDIKSLMDEGNLRRKVASTIMNEFSSRSHSVFTIDLIQRCTVAGLDTEKTSKISLVDLAGSERADSTGATGTRLKEGAEINRSLSTLGRVIAALADKEAGARFSGNSRIPYRDSVLTWLLKDSLGGNTLTVMLATISPAEISCDETLSTLRYANSAKRIKTHAIVNEDQNLKMIRELREELALLRAEFGSVPAGSDLTLDSLKDQTVTFLGANGAIGHMSKADMVERMEQTTELMNAVNRSWEQKLETTRRAQQAREETLKSLGIEIHDGLLGVSTPRKIPHLINLSEDPLASEFLIYNLKSGQTRCGNLQSTLAEIRLSGHSVHAEHCIFVNNDSVVTIIPHNEALVMVDGVRIISVCVCSRKL